jgi:hypothetical protein
MDDRGYPTKKRNKEQEFNLGINLKNKFSDYYFYQYSIKLESLDYIFLFHV